MNLKINRSEFRCNRSRPRACRPQTRAHQPPRGQPISVTVTLSLDKPDHKAEADAHLSGKNLHVEAVESENMYAAIDVMMDKLDRALIKHKEKSHNVRGAGKPAAEEAVMAENAEE